MSYVTGGISVLPFAILLSAFQAVAQPPVPPDPDMPRATLLYQNFPNPFPGPTGSTTCVWFDLQRASDVLLEIHDLRGNLVRRIAPSTGVPGRFPAGRYGRLTGNSPAGAGCDPRFSWDGTAADGRTVPAGIYLLRLRAGGVDSIRKIVFRGR